MSEILGKSSSEWEEREKLQRMSFMKIDGTIHKNIVQLIDQRALIAKRMLNCSDDKIYNEAKAIVDYYNENIKKILGM